MKNPAFAAGLSALWPGLGQIYNGDLLQGVIFTLNNLVFLWVFYRCPQGAMMGFPAFLVVYMNSVFDAYDTAESRNR